MTGPGIVWIRVDNFPMKEQMMEITAAPAVNLCDSHNADVFTVSGRRNGTDETGYHGGEVVTEDAAVKSRLF